MIQLRFEGGAELAQALRSLPERVSAKVMRTVLKDVAEPMRGRMSQTAPVGPDAPHMKDNIGISNARYVEGRPVADGQQVAVAIGPTKDYFYGLMWEFGWVNHPDAHPFARPAFDTEAPKALTEIGRRLWTELAGKGVTRVRATPMPVQSPGALL
jgi:HK97 gp10 family phage protein